MHNQVKEFIVILNVIETPTSFEFNTLILKVIEY